MMGGVYKSMDSIAFDTGHEITLAGARGKERTTRGMVRSSEKRTCDPAAASVWWISCLCAGPRLEVELGMFVLVSNARKRRIT